MSNIVYRLRFEKIEVDDYGKPLMSQDEGFNIQAQQMMSANELRAWREAHTSKDLLDKTVFGELKKEIIKKAWNEKV